MVTIGKVEVNVGKKTKKKNKLKNKSDGGVEGDPVKVKEAVEEGQKVWEPKLKTVEKKNIVQTGEDVSKEVLLYNSRPEDRGWADGGLVAKVVSGDSSLALQQRVEDTGFDNIVVHLWEATWFSFIVRGVEICGRFFMKPLIFLTCYLQTYTNGRQMMKFMKGVLGYEFMEPLYTLGMNYFLKFVYWDVGDSFDGMSARWIRRDWIMIESLFQLLFWRS